MPKLGMLSCWNESTLADQDDVMICEMVSCIFQHFARKHAETPATALCGAPRALPKLYAREREPNTVIEPKTLRKTQFLSFIS